MVTKRQRGEDHDQETDPAPSRRIPEPEEASPDAQQDDVELLRGFLQGLDSWKDELTSELESWRAKVDDQLSDLSRHVESTGRAETSSRNRSSKNKDSDSPSEPGDHTNDSQGANRGKKFEESADLAGLFEDFLRWKEGRDDRSSQHSVDESKEASSN